MNIQARLLCRILCLFAAAGTVVAADPPLNDFAGQWVIKLGSANFMVLSLHREGASLGGTNPQFRVFRKAHRMTNSRRRRQALRPQP
jgi:hypothetical protein